MGFVGHIYDEGGFDDITWWVLKNDFICQRVDYLRNNVTNCLTIPSRNTS